VRRLYSFARQASLYAVRLPVISLLLANRNTRYSARSANAFTVMNEITAATLYEQFQARPNIFNPAHHTHGDSSTKSVKATSDNEEKEEKEEEEEEGTNRSTSKRKAAEFGSSNEDGNGSTRRRLLVRTRSRSVRKKN